MSAKEPIVRVGHKKLNTPGLVRVSPTERITIAWEGGEGDAPGFIMIFKDASVAYDPSIPDNHEVTRHREHNQAWSGSLSSIDPTGGVLKVGGKYDLVLYRVDDNGWPSRRRGKTIYSLEVKNEAGSKLAILTPAGLAVVAISLHKGSKVESRPLIGLGVGWRSFNRDPYSSRVSTYFGPVVLGVGDLPNRIGAVAGIELQPFNVDAPIQLGIGVLSEELVASASDDLRKRDPHSMVVLQFSTNLIGLIDKSGAK